jgi:L-cystine transport system substrate-binding protein
MGRPIHLTALLLLAAFALACMPAAPAAPTAAPAASGGGVLDQVKTRGLLRVSNPQTSPPYSLRDEKNELVGFDVDFANELIKRMGIPKIEFIQGTFETFIPGVQTDKWDIVIAGQAITEERKQQVDFSLPYRMSGVSIFVNQTNDSIKTLDDLKGKRIALPAGAAQLKMAEGVAGAEIKTYENATLALTDVGLGRADGYLGSRFVGAYLAEKNGIKVKPTPTVLEVEQNAMSFKKGESALKAEVDKAVRAMLSDGTITTLSKKWFGASEDMAVELKKIGVQ